MGAAGDAQLEQVQRRRASPLANRRWREASPSSIARPPPRPRSLSSAARAGGSPRPLRRQPAKHEHLRAREQRGVDLERRILGRGADQHDVAGLDARQKRVLLRLVEAVDLVDEDDRAASGRAADALGLAHHVADFLDAGHHGAEGHEARLGRVGDDARQRRLAGAGRAPEDDRLQQVALDGLAERFAWASSSSWPTNSSNVRGRIRSARGAGAAAPVRPGKREDMLTLGRFVCALRRAS